MKFLTDQQYDALQARANNYDTVVAAFVAHSADTMEASDVTPEAITAVFDQNPPAGAPASEVEELNATITQLQDQLQAAEAERDQLQTENESLRQLPGAESVSGAPAVEPTAVVTDELLSFANANAGNTAAIAAKMIETGFVTPKNSK